MFGDRFPNSELDRFLEAAKEISLPFQCAHGRPSVLPVAFLQPPSSDYQVSLVLSIRFYINFLSSTSSLLASFYCFRKFLGSS